MIATIAPAIDQPMPFILGVLARCDTLNITAPVTGTWITEGWRMIRLGKGDIAPAHRCRPLVHGPEEQCDADALLHGPSGPHYQRG